MKGKETVEAVLNLLMQGERMSSMLWEAVDLGGDTDTVASLTLALGSICPEIVQDLPDWMFEQLENGPYGRSYIENLDRQLLAQLPITGHLNRNL
jgi:ADP-ribosylglycohydrolase